MRIHATPGRVAALYAAFSLAWILLFDTVVESRVPQYGGRLLWDALWGGVYVVLTGLLVYVLVLRVSRRAETERDWYSELFAASPDAIFILGPDGRISDANHVAVERYGRSLLELRTMTLEDLAPSGVREIHHERFVAAVAGSGRFESRHVTAGGRRIAVDVAVRPVRRGDEPRQLCTVRDISGLQTALETLRQSEEVQRALVACSPVALFSLTLDGRVLTWNPTAEQLTGWSEDEAVGQALPIVPEGREEEFNDLRRRVMQGEALSGVQVIRRRRDGSLFTGSLSVAPVRAAEGGIVGMMCAIEDITDRLEAEREREAIREQLFRAQRMEAVGELAGGVAHDFNNILQAMTGYARLLLDNTESDGLLREGLEEIHKGTERAAALTRQLLAFSRRQVMQPADLDLDAVVTDMLRMIRRLIPENVTVAWSPRGGLEAVRGDRGMVEQVLLNLCVNARDAMPDGGVISITTEAVDVGEAFTVAHPWALPGRYVLLKVTDTGCGMDPEVLDRVFEPFYTTRGGEGGTGLGLATVYGIVKQHEGMILADSIPGRGADFSVYLPVAPEPASPAAAAESDRADEPPGGDETILLAEDDDGARRLATRILELAGYKVLAGRDGAEAVALYRAHADRIAAVILDVVMPGMDGAVTLESIRAERPGLPALFVSGHVRRSKGPGAESASAVPLLRKPYTPEALLHAVRTLLDEAESRPK